MEQRPHLVIDGALLAADTVGADDVVLYVGADHAGAIQAMHRATTERPLSERARLRLISVARPLRLRRGDGGCALHQRGHRTADIHPATPVRARRRWAANARAERRDTRSRRADRTFRRRVVSIAGTRDATGTTLVTVGGAVPQTVLIEVPQGLLLAEAVNAAGGLTSDSDAVLLGGYFGGWVEPSAGLGSRSGCRTVAPARPFARVRRDRGAAVGAMRCRRDGPDPGVPRTRECSSMRSLHLRTPRHSRSRGPGLGSGCNTRRPRAHPAVGRSARGARRLPPSRRRSRSARLGAAGLWRRVPAPRQRASMQPRECCGGGIMSEHVLLGIDRIKCDGHGVCADLRSRAHRA